MNTAPLTSSSPARHASHSVRQDFVEDWMILVATWPSTFYDLSSWLDRVGWFGKMFPVCYRRREGGISHPSSGAWNVSGMAWRGECWTLSFSESRSDAVVSSSSGILETGVPRSPRFLTSQTCASILTAVQKKRANIPDKIRAALVRGAKRYRRYSERSSLGTSPRRKS